MAKLILSMENMVLKEIPLTKERTTIGRKPHNDIQIDNLAVSGEHAVVITILNDSFLEDLGSTNGTFVNGQPVKKHFMQTGDVVELGKYRLKYINDAPQHVAQEDFEKTMILRPGAAPGAQHTLRRLPLLHRHPWHLHPWLPRRLWLRPRLPLQWRHRRQRQQRHPPPHRHPRPAPLSWGRCRYFPVPIPVGRCI